MITMSKFLRVQCDCGNEQVLFGDSKTKVICLSCKKILVESTGGRARVNAKILEVLS